MAKMLQVWVNFFSVMIFKSTAEITTTATTTTTLFRFELLRQADSKTGICTMNRFLLKTGDRGQELNKTTSVQGKKCIVMHEPLA